MIDEQKVLSMIRDAAELVVRLSYWTDTPEGVAVHHQAECLLSAARDLARLVDISTVAIDAAEYDGLRRIKSA